MAEKKLKIGVEPLGEKLTSLVLTWNVEGFAPKKSVDVKGLFDPVLENRPNLIVVGLQEVFECKAYNITKIVSNSNQTEEGKRWRDVLTATLATVDPSYKLITSEVNGAVMMLFYSNLKQEDLKTFTTVRTNLGAMGGMIANKSSVTLNLSVRNIKVQFVACHLESGEGQKQNAQRISQLQTIIPTVVDSHRFDAPKKSVH